VVEVSATNITVKRVPVPPNLVHIRFARKEEDLGNYFDMFLDEREARQMVEALSKELNAL
jgi:hypothetical protein